MLGTAFGQTGDPDEEPVIELEPLVVTGTQIPKNTMEDSSSTTVISGESIEQSGATSVTEVLRSVEGLHIDQPGGRGGVSSVYLRGADPNHTIVLIDGIKVNDPMNTRGGSFDFSTLNADSIERIEIVRGPLSSVYGSDAVAGAIHIITKKPPINPETRLDFSGGTSGFYRGLLETLGTKGRFNYALGGGYLDNGEPVEGSESVNGNLQARTGFILSPRTDIRSVLRYSKSRMKTFPDDSGGPEYAVIRETETRLVDERTAGLEFDHHPVPGFSITLKGDYYARAEDVDSPGVAPGIRNPAGIPPNIAENDFRRLRGHGVARWKVFDGLQFSAGASRESEAGESEGLLFIPGPPISTDFNLRRDLWAAFLETRYQPGDLIVFEAGVRWDNPDDFKARFNPRAGLSFLIPSTQTRLKAGWGKAFKLPAFFSLSHPLVGNPDLEPEKSSSWEWGISQPFLNRRLTLHAAHFSSRVKDAIDFDETAFLLVNRDAIKTHGLELSGTIMTPRDLTLSPHLTYVKTDIENSAEDLRGRPEWRGGLGIDWKPSAFLSFFLDTLYIGEVHDSSIPTGDRDLDPYFRVNFAAAWTQRPGREFYLSVRNLLDADYEEALGFPAPGIDARAGVRLRL